MGEGRREMDAPKGGRLLAGGKVRVLLDRISMGDPNPAVSLPHLKSGA